MDLRIDGELLVVRLDLGERFWGFHRDLALPLTAIRHVRVQPDPWLTLRGWRASGVHVQGHVSRGSRRHGDGWDFVCLVRCGAAIEIDMTTGRYERLTLSVPDAEESVRRVAGAAGIAAG